MNLWSFLANRLYYPKINIFSSLITVSWFHAFKTFLFFLFSFFSKQFFCFSGFFLDIEAVSSLKGLLNSLGCSNYNLDYLFLVLLTLGLFFC